MAYEVLDSADEQVTLNFKQFLITEGRLPEGMVVIKRVAQSTIHSMLPAGLTLEVKQVVLDILYFTLFLRLLFFLFNIIAFSYYNILNTYYNIIDTYYKILNTYYNILNTYYIILNTYYIILNTYYNILNTWL